VSRELIRVKLKSNEETSISFQSSKSGSNREVPSHAEDNQNDPDILLSVESLIEARYKRTCKVYAGKIERCRFDGSFDVIYDNGERELGVAKDFIRSKDIKYRASH